MNWTNSWYLVGRGLEGEEAEGAVEHGQVDPHADLHTLEAVAHRRGDHPAGLDFFFFFSGSGGCSSSLAARRFHRHF
ncbi:Os01g0122367, partial [Oryza sativa Japonica Group]